MRRISALLSVLALLIVVAAPSAAAEPKCPLDLNACLNEFDKMRNRPWLGVEIDVDSAGSRVVKAVVPGGPAARGGIQPGDHLEQIEGVAPADWFATKAGWKNEPTTAVKVTRRGRTVELKVKNTPIPEEMLAKRIGVHMLEGHLAYAHDETAEH